MLCTFTNHNILPTNVLFYHKRLNEYREATDDIFSALESYNKEEISQLSLNFSENNVPGGLTKATQNSWLVRF